ncbi:MAG TPA: hypothetical protein VH591_05635 [Ktedonobacterales bacterium]|jgi:hypothetical protein
MQETMPTTRWQRWRHALAFGLPLGVLELGLIYITVLHSYWLSQQQATLIGWLLCLLIPGAAGYHICYLGDHTRPASGWEGLRVGVVGSTVVLAGFAAWLVVTLIIYDNTPPPPGPRTFYSPAIALFVAIVLLGLLAMISFVGLAFSAVGGRIGGALAAWRIKRLEARSQRTS